MIDLHCHLLPGIDDGPESIEQSLELARIAVNDGIRKSVVTPHIHPGRYENDLAIISEAVASFREHLDQHDIDLEVGIGAEVRIGPEIMPMVAEGQIPFIGRHDGYDVLLLELPHGNIPLGSDKLTAWLLQRNIMPMIAHPERNKDVMRDLNRLAPFVEQGCLFQLTAQSVAGGFGDTAHDRAVQMLERGWVTILATDAHNAGFRPPLLSPGRDAAAQIIGEAAAWSLVSEMPEKIARDNHVATETLMA